MFYFQLLRRSHFWKREFCTAGGTNMKICCGEIMEAPLIKLFFTSRMKRLSRPDGSILYGKLGTDFSSTSESPHPKRKVRLWLIRARLILYIISDNPNLSLAFVDCSIYTDRMALRDDYHKNKIDMLEHTPVDSNYLENLAKTTINPARQNQFIQENILYTARLRRTAIAMNTNSAFTGSYTENSFWYQQFDLRQTRMLGAVQPIVDFDAAEKILPLFYNNESNELSRWYPLNSNWEFQRPLCSSVWFDLNQRRSWKKVFTQN